jgi:hypothetical protein
MKPAVFLSFLIFAIISSTAFAVSFRPQTMQLAKSKNTDELAGEKPELLETKMKALKKRSPFTPDSAYEAVSIQEVPDCQYVPYCYYVRGRQICTNQRVCN